MAGQRAQIAMLGVMGSEELRLVAVSVGNTRTTFGCFLDGKPGATRRLANEDMDIIAREVGGAVTSMEEPGQATPRIVLASVNDRMAGPLSARLEGQSGQKILRVERDLRIPIGRCVDDDAQVGQDRLLNAAAAYDRLKQACVVVDAGTAVTVDFVDGEGTFHGGAIAPGAKLQLRALHEGTALLPAVEFAAPPADDPFGRNTRDAMLNGVFYGIRGMVRHLVERYAEKYEAYPTVIATGGDAHTLFDGDELIDRVIDDLTLMGIEVTCRYNLAGDVVGE